MLKKKRLIFCVNDLQFDITLYELLFMFLLHRWSFGVLLWEIFTLGKPLNILSSIHCCHYILKKGL